MAERFGLPVRAARPMSSPEMREPGPTNLTALPTSFVGRTGALRALGDSLSRSRLVTVLGPPGTGKTRLVKQYALSLLGTPAAPPGGVFFCDLSEATAPSGVFERLSQAIGIDLGEALPMTEARRHIEAALRAREPMLVLLDNYEQLVRSAAALVSDFLAAAPAETRFVVTSRERLGIAGEALFDLGPLSLPGDSGDPESEAVQLFVERARAAGASFAPTPAELRDIARLVRLLDGLPLAIELAAARMRILAPAELIERFGSRSGWLTHDPSALRPRHATLWETIEASWALLPPWEQEALAQVSAFRGGFGVSAAESILDLTRFEAAPPALDVLQSLRDKSLLLAEQSEGPARRFTLLGSIRDFGEGKLDAAGLRSVHERHARYYLGLGERLSARLELDDVPEIHRELRLEHENFLAVHRRFLAAPAASAERPSGDLGGASLRAALVLARSASAHPYAFSLEALDAALAITRAEEVGSLLVARGLEARGNLRRFVGQTRGSIEDFERVLELAAREEDRGLMASALSGLGNAATVRARWAEAGELFERALALVATVADRRAEGRLLAMLAATWFNRDDPARARALLSRAIDLARESKDRSFEGISVTSLGVVSLALGSLGEARARLAEGLLLHREVGARHWEGVTLSYMALAEHDSARPEEAHRLYERAIRLLAEINVKRPEGLALAGSAGVLLEERRIEEARERYRKALDLLRAVGPDHEGLVLGCLGAVAALEGEIVAASDLFECAERALAPHDRPAFVAAIGVYRGLLDLSRARGATDPERAALLREARARLDGASEWASRSVEVRCAARLLAAELRALPADVPAVIDRNALVVGPSGLWFRAPRARESVRLHRRRALARLVHHLAEHRLRSPGEALSIPALVERGWPGERVLPEAGTERVYTAVATLRRLGLRKLLLQRDDGYLLDAAVVLVRSPSSA